MVERMEIVFNDSQRKNLRDKMTSGNPKPKQKTKHEGVKDDVKSSERLQIHTRDIRKHDGTKSKLYIVEDISN